jgi:hypothetical protein
MNFLPPSSQGVTSHKIPLYVRRYVTTGSVLNLSPLTDACEVTQVCSVNLISIGPCIVIYSYSTTNHLLSQIIYSLTL